jgi:hypothetical protein
MIDDLSTRARQALAHPRLRHLMALIPSEDRGDPRALALWLSTAASFDPRGASSQAYKDVFSAVQAWGEARDLNDRVSRAYHNPKLRAEIGVERIEAAMRDPETAYAELIERSAAGGLSPALDEALNMLGEVRQFVTERGGEMPPPAVAPIPTDAVGRETEIQRLIAKSVAGELTKAEDQRLDELFEAQTDDAEAAAATRTAAAPDEFDRLVQRSISGELTPEDDARLNHLAGARAIEAGLVPEDDYQEQ